jgi:hypothetical protein
VCLFVIGSQVPHVHDTPFAFPDLPEAAWEIRYS